jgi:hypothetical protein
MTGHNPASCRAKNTPTTQAIMWGGRPNYGLARPIHRTTIKYAPFKNVINGVTHAEKKRSHGTNHIAGFKI